MKTEQARRRSFNWRREATFPTQALAESILVAPWLLLLIIGARRVAPQWMVGACLVLILGTLYLTRSMAALRINTSVQRAVILIEILAVCAMAMNWTVFNGPEWTDWAWLRHPIRHWADLIRFLPTEIIVVLGVAWLCWRGLRLAQRPISVTDTMRGFQMGVIVLSVFVLMSSALDLTFFIPAYFFCQLLAVALTRVETIAQERGGKRSPFDAWWLTMLVGSTGAVILVAGLVSAFVLGIEPGQWMRWLVPIFAILTLPVMLLLIPVLAVLSILIDALLRPLVLWWQNRFADLAFGPFPAGPESKPLVNLELVLRVIGYSSTLLVIAGVLAAVLAVVWVVGRRRRPQEHDESDQHEYVWSSRALLRKITRQVQNRLKRLRNLADIAGRFGASGLFTALTIRRMYAQTVRLAASRGYPRPPSRTPYEHLTALQQAFPGCKADLTRLTEAYVRVHYGELPEDPDALVEIRAAFEHIKSAGRQGDKETKRSIR